MKKLLFAVALLAVPFLSGCASKPAPSPTKTLNAVCLISDEALDGSGPTADYMGGKVGFCCKDCAAKWNGMDEAAKKAAFEAKTKK